MLLILFLIKNVSSSTSHKKTLSFRLSLREFKKILPNTFIYESILIKIYMNFNIMNTQNIFKISMTSTVIEGDKFHFYCNVNLNLR